MSPSDLADDLNQAGLAAFAGDRFVEAEDLYRRAIAAQPTAHGHWHNLGVLLYALGRLEEARAAFLRALDGGKPVTRYSLAMTLLRLGNYTEGWPLFEARRALPTARFTEADLPVPYWKGEPLDGREIVLFPEQGLGDTLQMARFALTLRDRGARVTLVCATALAPLLAARLDGVAVKALEGQLDLGSPDVWALLGSLPHLLKIGADVASTGPYLGGVTPPSRPRGPLRVGLVTRGNPAHANDARRSLSEAQAARLRRLKDVEVVSLHPEDSGARDFAQTASLMAGLDLLVSIDSAVAHLAGAMGLPTLLLVPGFNTDWRWRDDRNDTPWYPAHQLFRGAVDGDWSRALAGVESAVAARVSTAAAPRTDA